MFIETTCMTVFYIHVIFHRENYEWNSFFLYIICMFTFKTANFNINTSSFHKNWGRAWNSKHFIALICVAWFVRLVKLRWMMVTLCENPKRFQPLHFGVKTTFLAEKWEIRPNYVKKYTPKWALKIVFRLDAIKYIILKVLHHLKKN